MKVTLLYPEVYDMARFRQGRKEFPPFGVLYLGAVVESAGHDVRIRKVTPETDSLDLSDCDAVGFSLASSATYGLMLNARRRARIRDDALVMVGGVHANFYPERSLTDFIAHVGAAGESEETILDILDRVDTRRFNGVPGVLWYDNGELRRESSRQLLRDIDQLPLPARHLLPVEDFVLPDRLAGAELRMTHVMFSRGCPFPCTFCAAGQTRIQYRSGARELITLRCMRKTLHALPIGLAGAAHGATLHYRERDVLRHILNAGVPDRLITALSLRIEELLGGQGCLTHRQIEERLVDRSTSMHAVRLALKPAWSGVH